MIYVYTAIAAILLIFALCFCRYQKEKFQNIDKKAHPLLLLYPAVSKIIDVWQKLFVGKRVGKIDALLKSLYVKENIFEEKYLYRIKKAACVFAVAFVAALLGILLCALRINAESVRSVQRKDPGRGVQTYDLQVQYQEKEEVIQLPIAEKAYTEEEIYALFDASIEAIQKEALGANESQKAVTKPMKFFSSYQNIQVFWEIEDPDILGYDGKIKTVPKDGEVLVLNLFVTLQLEEVRKTYHFPVALTALQRSEQERLTEEIQNAVAQQNDVHEKEVLLPERINGEKISFKQARENKDGVLLLFGFLAIFVIAFGYDKGLEKKVNKRKEELLTDFGEIVGKLSLLYEAGASIRQAWEKIVSEQEEKQTMRYAYLEMKLVLEKIGSGMAEREAYAQFGKRCGLHPYVKLGNLLEQNLAKGSKGMKLLLKQETADALEERKRRVRKKGEEASTKMLFPMVVMLLVVMVIIAVPAFLSMQL